MVDDSKVYFDQTMVEPITKAHIRIRWYVTAWRIDISVVPNLYCDCCGNRTTRIGTIEMVTYEHPWYGGRGHCVQLAFCDFCSKESRHSDGEDDWHNCATRLATIRCAVHVMRCRLIESFTILYCARVVNQRSWSAG